MDATIEVGSNGDSGQSGIGGTDGGNVVPIVNGGNGISGPVKVVPAPPVAFPWSMCRITFSGVDPSEPPKVEVRAWLDRLGALTAPLLTGLVVIDATGGDPRRPRQYQVRMELTMPGGLVVVGTEHPSNKPHEDLYCAIRNAFRAARRQLEEQLLERDAGAAAAQIAARDAG